MNIDELNQLAEKSVSEARDALTSAQKVVIAGAEGFAKEVENSSAPDDMKAAILNVYLKRLEQIEKDLQGD